MYVIYTDMHMMNINVLSQMYRYVLIHIYVYMYVCIQHVSVNTNINTYFSDIFRYFRVFSGIVGYFRVIFGIFGNCRVFSGFFFLFQICIYTCARVPSCVDTCQGRSSRPMRSQCEGRRCDGNGAEGK